MSNQNRARNLSPLPTDLVEIDLQNITTLKSLSGGYTLSGRPRLPHSGEATASMDSHSTPVRANPYDLSHVISSNPNNNTQVITTPGRTTSNNGNTVETRRRISFGSRKLIFLIVFVLLILGLGSLGVVKIVEAVKAKWKAIEASQTQPLRQE